MNDLPSVIALQQSNARPKTGEDLEVMGKEAATQFCRGRYNTLTEAVVETVKSASLSPEQVRRVVEFTNIDAFNQEFKKEGSGHKVVEFKGGPANFPEILRDLNDGGNVTTMDKHAFDYSAPPPNVAALLSHNEDRLGLENTKLAEAFGVEEVALPYADPLRDSLDMKDKLAGLESELATELSFLEGQYHEIVQDLSYQVKQACLEGTELGQIVQAWHSVTSKPEFVKAAFIHLTPALLEGGVFSSRIAIGDSLMKTASSGMVNHQHPLVIRFQDFCETLTKTAEVRAAHNEVAGYLDNVSTFIKSASVKLASVVDAAGKVWNASKSVADEVAPHAGEFLRDAGQAAGNIAEVALPYTPHAAVAYGGYKGYQAGQQSPTVQKILSYVPGTQQNQLRQYYERGGQ